MNSEATLRNRNAITAIIVVIAVYLLSYWSTISYLITVWMTDEEYAHGFFVIPVSLWILFSRRDTMPEPSAEGSNWGITFIAIAASMRMISARLYLPEIDAWSIPVSVCGGICFFAGMRVLIWALPAIGFLWMMTRIPATLELALSFPLQKLAANISTFLLQTCGIAAFNEGTIIELNSGPVNVQEACSGLKMFMSSISIACAFVLLTRRRRTASILIIASVIPIAVLANTLRIATTGLLYEFTGNETLRTIVHDAAGLLMIAISLSLLVGTVFLVEKLIQMAIDDRRRVGVICMSCVFVAALFVGGVVVFHRLQLSRLEKNLDEGVTQAETDQNWPEAERLLKRIMTVSDDQQLRNRLARVYLTAPQLLEQHDRLDYLIDVAKSSNQDPELLLEVAELAAKSNQHRLAYELSQKGIEAAGDHADQRLFSIRARSLNSMLTKGEKIDADWSTLASQIESSLEKTKQTPDLYYQLALLYRDQLLNRQRKTHDRADDLIEQMIHQNEENPLAWFARFDYRRRYPDSRINRQANHDYDQDLDRAETLLNNQETPSIALLYALAKRALVREQFDQVSNYANRIASMQPKSKVSYLLQSERFDAENNLAGSIASLEKGIQACGPQIELLIPMVQQLLRSGESERANQLIDETKSLLENDRMATRFFEVIIADANAWALAQKGEYVEAVNELLPCFRNRESSLRTDPSIARIWHTLASYASAAMLPDLAIEVWDEAVSLDPNLKSQPPFASVVEKLDLIFERQSQNLSASQVDAARWKSLAQMMIKRNEFLPKIDQNWKAFQIALHAARKGSADDDLDCDALEVQYLLLAQQEQRLLDKISSSPYAHLIAQHAAKKFVGHNPNLAIEVMQLPPTDPPGRFRSDIDLASFQVLNAVLITVVDSGQRNVWERLAERWILGPRTAGSFANVASREIGWLAPEVEATIRRHLPVENIDAFTRFVIGNLEFAKKKYELAKFEFRQGLIEAPDNVAMLNNSALCSIELSEFASAKKDLERAIRLAPENESLSYSMALYKICVDEPRNALNRLLELYDSDNIDVSKLDLHIAFAFLDLQKPKSAKVYFDRAKTRIKSGEIALTNWEQKRLRRLEDTRFE